MKLILKIQMGPFIANVVILEFFKNSEIDINRQIEKK